MPAAGTRITQLSSGLAEPPILPAIKTVAVNGRLCVEHPLHRQIANLGRERVRCPVHESPSFQESGPPTVSGESSGKYLTAITEYFGASHHR